MKKDFYPTLIWPNKDNITPDCRIIILAVLQIMPPAP